MSQDDRNMAHRKAQLIIVTTSRKQLIGSTQGRQWTTVMQLPVWKGQHVAASGRRLKTLCSYRKIKETELVVNFSAQCFVTPVFVDSYRFHLLHQLKKKKKV